MKRLALLLVALLIIPSVLADVLKESHNVAMKSNLIGQGYKFAKVEGVNRLDVPISVLRWHMRAQVNQLYSACEIQPTTLPPGAFELDTVVQCQTRSGLTVLYPPGTTVTIDTYAPDSIPPASFSITGIKIETRVQQPTPFEATPIAGEAVLEASGDTAGTFMFIAGISAIIILAVIVVLSSIMQKE